MENNIHQFEIPDASEQTFLQRAQDAYTGVFDRINMRINMAYGSLLDKMQPADEAAALRQQRWQTARAWGIGAAAVGMIFQRAHGINLLEGIEGHVQAAQDVGIGSGTGMHMRGQSGAVEIPYRTAAMSSQIDDPTPTVEAPSTNDIDSMLNRQSFKDWFKGLFYTGDASHAAVDIGPAPVDDPPAAAPDIYSDKPAPLILNLPEVQVPDLTPRLPSIPTPEITVPPLPPVNTPEITLPSFPPTVEPNIPAPSLPPATLPEVTTPAAPPTTPPPVATPGAPQPTEPPEVVPGIDRYGAQPSSDEYLWTYINEHERGQTNIMADLEEASNELEKKTGAKVRWFGSGIHRWLKINGRSDTPYLWRLLAPFYRNN